MRSLGLTRYRILTNTRTMGWVFGVTLGAAAIAVLFGSRVVFPVSRAYDDPVGMMHGATQTVQAVYFWHIVILAAACDLLGRPKREADGSLSYDLTETAPIGSGARYQADTLGILGSVLMVHVTTLPLLALAVAVSPLPSSAFFWLELLTLAVLYLTSAAASWKLRGSAKWARSRSIRSLGLFALLLLLIVIFNTRWEAFRDAAAMVISDPAPQRWEPLAAAIVNAPLLGALVLLLYGGFIAYYALDSIRLMERR